MRDVFLVINGSGRLSNAFVHPTFEALLRDDAAAYVVYDKPGVRAPFGDPGAVKRDGSVFEQYTMGHGIACATESLRWARTRFGPSARLHIRGHSEGSLVALYTYDALLESNDPLAEGIRTLVLSGLAVEPFADILDRQLSTAPDGAQQRRALASCDFRLLETTLGVSCAYVNDASRRPSGRATFERLAIRSPRARFYVFQGEHDWNTPVEPVRALQAWNDATGHLPIEFHYYDGGHAGSDAARAEVASVLTAIVSDPSP